MRNLNSSCLGRYLNEREEHLFKTMTFTTGIDSRLNKVKSESLELPVLEFDKLSGDWFSNLPIRLLIAGTSGTGKTWLSHQIAAKINRPVLSLDSFGFTSNNQWLADWGAFTDQYKTKKYVVEGSVDNFSDAPSFNMVLFPIPDADTFRAINKAKFIDSQTKDVPEAFRTGWKMRSTMSDRKIDKLIKSKIELVVKYLHESNPQIEVVLISTPVAQTIQNGWHGDSSKGSRKEDSNEK